MFGAIASALAGPIIGSIFGGKNQKNAARDSKRDSMELARLQNQYNQQAFERSLKASRVNQENPWGKMEWNQNPDGTWGQKTSLHEADQRNLDFRRGIGNTLLGGIGGMSPPAPTGDLATKAQGDTQGPSGGGMMQNGLLQRILANANSPADFGGLQGVSRSNLRGAPQANIRPNKLPKLQAAMMRGGM